MPNGKQVTVELFDFSREGASPSLPFSFSIPLTLPPAELSIAPALIRHLVPTHYAPRLSQLKGIDINAFRPVNVDALRAVID